MPLDQMALLEKKVRQLLELARRFKEDKTLLDKKVRTVGQQLAKQERDTLRWQRDRVRLRSKVERILSEVGVLSERSGLTGGGAAKQRKRGGA